MSREGKDALAIHIVPFSIFAIVILSALVTGFPIWKGLVISGRPDNNGPVNNEGTMGPVEAEVSADKEGLADVEKFIPADAKKLIVICYKYQY